MPRKLTNFRTLFDSKGKLLIAADKDCKLCEDKQGEFHQKNCKNDVFGGCDKKRSKCECSDFG